MDVKAVIVTFNRVEMLQDCLDSLLSQSHYISQVIIIDNSTIDDTENMIRTYHSQELGSRRVKYMRQAQNLGGAGGFKLGIYEACEEYNGLVWIMDDDVQPDLHCLSQMVAGFYKFGSGCCYIPLIRHHGSDAIQNYHYKNFDSIYRNKQVELSSIEGRRYVSCDSTSFVGLMFHSCAVKKLGLPRSEYFIRVDDTDYSYRFDGCIICCDAVIIHKDDIQKFSNVKKYYEIRNAIDFHLRRAHTYKGNWYGNMCAVIRLILTATRMQVRNFLTSQSDINNRMFSPGVRFLPTLSIVHGFIKKLGKTFEL